MLLRGSHPCTTRMESFTSEPEYHTVERRYEEWNKAKIKRDLRLRDEDLDEEYEDDEEKMMEYMTSIQTSMHR